MTYKMEIIHDFSGTIDGVPFDDKQEFFSVGFILDQLEENDLEHNQDLIKELQGTMNYILSKDYFTLEDIERDIFVSLEERKCFPTDIDAFKYANALLYRLNPPLEPIKMSFYNGTMNKDKLKVFIEDTDKDIKYTYGLAMRGPTTHNKPISKIEAIEVIDRVALLDATEYEDYLHLNAYIGNDMW